MMHNVLTPDRWEEAIEILARIGEEASEEASALREALEERQGELAKAIAKEAVSSLRKELANLQALLGGYFADKRLLKEISPKDWEPVVALLEAIAQKTQRGVDYIKTLIEEGKTEIVEDMLELAIEDLNWDLWKLEDLLIGHEPKWEV